MNTQPITDRQRELIGLLVGRLTRQQASQVIEYINDELGVKFSEYESIREYMRTVWTEAPK